MIKFSVTRLYSDKDDESNQEPFFDRGERTKGRPLVNKNRLCSKTCGVDIDIEDKKDQAKIEGFFS